MSVPRSKTFLVTALKNWLAFLKPGDLNMSDDALEITYCREYSNGVRMRIKDVTGMHYYDVLVTERRAP